MASQGFFFFFFFVIGIESSVQFVGLLYISFVVFDFTLTLTIQDSGPFSHRTMFRFSKLKLICLGGLGMVPIRSLL